MDDLADTCISITTRLFVTRIIAPFNLITSVTGADSAPEESAPDDRAAERGYTLLHRFLKERFVISFVIGIILLLSLCLYFV